MLLAGRQKEHPAYNKKLCYRRGTARYVVSLKSCQLPRNSAETTYTTTPDQIDGMKLEIKSEVMRDRQSALNHDSIESAPIVSSVINKPTT